MVKLRLLDFIFYGHHHDLLFDMISNQQSNTQTYRGKQTNKEARTKLCAEKNKGLRSLVQIKKTKI